MEALGIKIRRQRRRLGLTLDEVAGRASISKPYLSLIETSWVPNPPSDEKLSRLEQTLGFSAGELLTQAHLLRTPRDVRAMLSRLLAGEKSEGTSEENPANGNGKGHLISSSSGDAPNPDNAGAEFLAQIMRESAGVSATEFRKMSANAVPVINRVSAGYPSDFDGLSYPPRVADQYIGCPDIQDKEAFAARVHGDSMMPKFRPGDIVIFSPKAPPRNGDDCFVRFSNGQTTFNRIFFETKTGGLAPMIRLQPRNECYVPTTIRVEKVSGLYRAAYHVQKLDED